MFISFSPFYYLFILSYYWYSLLKPEVETNIFLLMNTPKYSNTSYNSYQVKNYHLLNEYTQINGPKGFSPFATNTKAFEKIVTQYNESHYKMRENYERKNIFTGKPNNLKLESSRGRFNKYE